MARNSQALTKRLAVFEGPEELRLRTWVQFVRTYYVIHRRLVSLLAREDLTLPQFDLLATLRFSEGVTQQELADRLLVTKGNVCGVIDRLQLLGWVERRSDPNDGRANRLHLTAIGRRKIEATLPAHDQFILQAMQFLSDEDARSLRFFLEGLERRAEHVE